MLVELNSAVRAWHKTIDVQKLNFVLYVFCSRTVRVKMDRDSSEDSIYDAMGETDIEDDMDENRVTVEET